MLDQKKEKLLILLKDFYKLTGIKTCLYDLNGNELCFYPERLTKFCATLRCNEEMDQKCRECDKTAFANCRKTHTQYTYTCHAGLTECISPIIFDGKLYGFIMIGQIKKPESKLKEEVLLNLTNTLSEILKDSYESLPTISDDKLYSSFRILDACASYHLLRELATVYDKPIEVRIQEYVESKIETSISVSDLCKDFHLSHNELYTLFMRYFDMPPAKYVKNVRLEYAARLLKNTNLAVGDIAVKCGIPDYNYFSKIFKSIYKISPTEYRKRQGH